MKSVAGPEPHHFGGAGTDNGMLTSRKSVETMLFGQ
jgi:hypothetical protein